MYPFLPQQAHQPIYVVLPWQQAHPSLLRDAALQSCFMQPSALALPSPEHSDHVFACAGSALLRRIPTTGCRFIARRGPKRRKKDKRGGSSKPPGKRKTRGMVAEKRRPRNFAALLEEACAPDPHACHDSDCGSTTSTCAHAFRLTCMRTSTTSSLAAKILPMLACSMAKQSVAIASSHVAVWCFPVEENGLCVNPPRGQKMEWQSSQFFHVNAPVSTGESGCAASGRALLLDSSRGPIHHGLAAAILLGLRQPFDVRRPCVLPRIHAPRVQSDAGRWIAVKVPLLSHFVARRYACTRCSSRFCGRRCNVVHMETQCLKFVA